MDPNAVHIQMPTASQEEGPSSTQDATKKKQPQQQADTATPKSPPVRPALSCASSDLLKLLPTGTVLAFQALAPSFSNHGVCHGANRYLVLSLLGACTVSCVLLSFTDSLVGRDGKLYHGAATFRGFYPFNYTGTREEREATFKDLSRFRITALDFVHAFFSALVFLAGPRRRQHPGAPVPGRRPGCEGAAGEPATGGRLPVEHGVHDLPHHQEEHRVHGHDAPRAVKRRRLSTLA